ncbi:hypothetical protein H8356DRAFT_1350677 [Neocallimastix lanati (nom. inval.)]|jgi:signal transduction histidine kinase|uniref:COPI associated n=1 Tax=Neocallimastix californiae TaxID=1754190 RepID=A0A1Y2C0N0_9FUNG|nr:hypothetical protein H8356DRAFT_1350677 [Neocallimastix sp. JGI-2020a]ORY40603.1 hypothetical protein LY90DRAFT_36129 [Neocallimastix californiae]|eukprot:ORY40603.1 hypothetical protein LY90DRAFT_36129 [Neocallimastix californiae]
MQKKLIYQIINVVTAILIGISGVYNLIKIFSNSLQFSAAIINLYYIAFAILFIMIAFREIDIIETEMHFLYSYFGRGLTYLFIGLSLWTTDISIPMVASVVIVCVALVYIVQYFKNAEPEF